MHGLLERTMPATGTVTGIDLVLEAHLPSLRRCTRVRRSSLRCFFFDMRLRRFLITDPMWASLTFLVAFLRTPVTYA